MSNSLYEEIFNIELVAIPFSLKKRETLRSLHFFVSRGQLGMDIKSAPYWKLWQKIWHQNSVKLSKYKKVCLLSPICKFWH